MLGRRRPDPVLEVFADFALAGQIKQERVLRLLGDAPSWHVDLDAGVAEIGDARFRLDVVGTVGATGTWLWAWANPSLQPELVRSSLLVRRVGVDWDIAALAAEDEITLDPHVAGAIAAGIAAADGYYVGHHDDGALVFLLRGRVLRESLLTAHDVLPVLDRLVAGELPVAPRAALEGLAGDPPAGVEAEIEGDRATIAAPGGRFTLALDRRDRVADLRADLDPTGSDPVSPGAARGQTPCGGATQGVRPLESEGLRSRAAGTLVLPPGPVVIFDPLLAVATDLCLPRPGALPGGSHTVSLELDEEDGDVRVTCADLVVGPGDPAWWQPVGSVIVDSGVCAFAAPAAAEMFIREGEPAAQALAADLEASADVTTRAAARDGLVAFSAGLGAGEYDLAWGFDADDRLVRVAVRFLPEPPSDLAVPGRGVQRSALQPLAAGGPFTPENVVVLPTARHDALSAVHRRLLRTLVAGEEVEAEMLPEYDGDDETVPARVVIRVGDGADAVVV